MGAHGAMWMVACAGLAAAWVLAASWRAETGTVVSAVRGVLGGLAALGTASIGYGLLQVAGLEIRWEWIQTGAWPAVGFAAIVGLVEETAKVAGIALAAPGTLRRTRARDVVRTSAAVAAVFAVAEALLALRGASWPVALGRAALAPVGHGVLVAPAAVVLAEASGGSRARLAGRLAIGVALAALLHGVGDWSVGHAGWGRAAFMASMLAPTLWLYARARRPARAECLYDARIRWAAGSPSRNR